MCEARQCHFGSWLAARGRSATVTGQVTVDIFRVGSPGREREYAEQGQENGDEEVRLGPPSGLSEKIGHLDSVLNCRQQGDRFQGG
jgi:hypothetical protein